MAMLVALQRMEGYEEVTMHGFRSAFKTWAEERTKFKSGVIESCLAHKFAGLDENYLRTTFPEHRRRLMQQWAAFVTQPSAKVLAFHG
jgi:integrase